MSELGCTNFVVLLAIYTINITPSSPLLPSLLLGKMEPHSSFNMGYLVSPYSYTNGGGGGLPVSMVSTHNLYIGRPSSQHPIRLPKTPLNGTIGNIEQVAIVV